MNKKKYFYSFLLILISQFTGAQSGPAPNPCNNATWKAISFPFTLDVHIPYSKTDTQFTAELKWNQLQNGMHICGLKNPSITIDGYKKKLPLDTNSGGKYWVDIEIESYGNDDKFLLDETVVTPSSQNMNSYNYVPNGTSSPDISGSRQVFYSWRDIAQPVGVAIVGDEGDVLEIDHTSPTVFIRTVYDSAGKRTVIFDSYGKQVYPNLFNKVWRMKHKVSVNQ